MVHVGLASVVLLAVAAQGTALQAVAQTARQDYLAERLRDAVSFDGFDDPRTTLQDALEYLRDRFDLTFDLDEQAFSREKVKDIRKTPIVGDNPIEKFQGAPLETVLGKIISRLPSEAEPIYLIRRSGIVITTKKAASKLILGDENKPLPPLVFAKFEKSPLNEALADIGNHTQVNIVMDESVAAKGEEKVSVRFMNTPVDTAVRILADRHGFTSLRMDNVIYVTSREKAASLREDIEKEKKIARQMSFAD
jgi:hypothetical protein